MLNTKYKNKGIKNEAIVEPVMQNHQDFKNASS
jgi:hypothetical protein